VSNWKKQSSGSYIYNFEIPEGTTANVYLPLSSSQKIIVKTKNEFIDIIDGIEEGKFKLTNGNYDITILD